MSPSASLFPDAWRAVSCPYCRVAPGEPCHRKGLDSRASKPHAARMERARSHAGGTGSFHGLVQFVKKNVEGERGLERDDALAALQGILMNRAPDAYVARTFSDDLRRPTRPDYDLTAPRGGP